ncbi:Hypothetical predicted protein [Octopus vulgaris]|uniref:VOC domain-containing protein n=1 Tax=Octopus vulgaris TaxID=6645 RepID=A0AA36BVG4_OCTVU|nr:Hypothetical predicted protein [Octopus vulgaris]
MSSDSIDEEKDFVGEYRIGTKRPLHFVFKISNRKENLHFFQRILGMRVLRHEEFVEGCKAHCNGPYDGRWSKTMIGYGSEDSHFVMELTYNYNIGSYHHGNDFWGITIFSKTIMDSVRKNKYKFTEEHGGFALKSPDGYKFLIMEQKSEGDPVKKVTLCVSDLTRSIDFWSRLMGMAVYCQSEQKAELGFDGTSCNLELIKIAEPFDRGTAYGRIAFAVPRQELPIIQRTLEEERETILTPLLALDTPGKATVEVVICADPDNHEICFVGDEAFKELSKIDTNAPSLLDKAIEGDKSEEWFEKKGKTKIEG